MFETMHAFLSSPLFLGAWSAVVALCLVVLARDLAKRNAGLGRLMKAVWLLTVLYSGPLGLAVYWYSGRAQIARDSLWRRGFRSVAHCYSGCGAGEVVGVFIAAGLFALGTWWVAGITFVLAYLFGFALTVGPLLEGGESLRAALVDAAASETASITVMEIVSITVDFLLGGNSRFHEPLFWGAMVVSLSAGLIAAYPVNVLLIAFGIKEGMHDPRHATSGA